MDLKKTNIEEWIDNEPDEKSQEEVKKKFIEYLKKAIGKITFAKDALALFFLFSDPQYPSIKKGIAVFALLYFIVPVDIIPDALPGGWLDDAGVVMAAIKMYANDIKPYEEKALCWLKENGYT